MNSNFLLIVGMSAGFLGMLIFVLVLLFSALKQVDHFKKKIGILASIFFIITLGMLFYLIGNFVLLADFPKFSARVLIVWYIILFMVALVIFFTWLRKKVYPKIKFTKKIKAGHHSVV
jgi:hypothetical protein